MKYFIAFLLLSTVAIGQQPPVPATLVLRNGKIVTVDEKMPEAQAIAIRGDRIAAVGSDASIQPFIGPSTQVIDLRGQLAIPGLIESHGHFMGLGQSKMTLDLMDVKDWNEIISMVADAAKQAKPGEWIIGRGWHQEKWSSVPKPNVEGFPFHDELSKVSPNNPVMLTHASGHASFVNAKAMEAAGITAATQNPSGGEILKSPAGQPIGLLRETASGIAGRALEAWRAKKTAAERDLDARRQIDLAVKASLEAGITSFHDAGSNFSTIDAIKRAANDGALGIRLWVMVRDSNENLTAKLAQYRAIGLNQNHLTIAAIKVVADGALGSRGAWMLAPYSDSPSSVGLPTNSPESIAQTARIALENNVQLCVHAIGDRANREVLNVYERSFKLRPDQKDFRWRVEHAQHIDPADIPRFGQLGVIAAMQGIHATSDAPYVLARLGAKRAEEGAYVWQKLMKSGAIVANGTDVPVERIDPMANFYATVTRKTKDGSVFFGDQKMSRAEALKSYTWSGAYAAKEESLKGSLAVGKLADITVLSKDIMTVPEDEILTTTAVYTIVGGKVAYSRPVSQAPAPASSAEIDREIWSVLTETVATDDIDGMGRTYLPDAVLVSPNGTAPIKLTLERWGRDMVTAKAKGDKATVAFRFARRLDGPTTAFESGIFKYTVIAKSGVATPKYYPFEQLLAKTNGKWQILMERQFAEVTQAEWDKLPQ